MKAFHIIFLFIFPSFFLQEQTLPKNQVGMVHFEGSIEASDIDEDEMMKKVVSYVSTIKKVSKYRPEVAVNYQNGQVVNKGSFYVYTQGLITRQIHGEIIYSIKLDVNEGAFTYSFSDFVFQYYQRNRYGKYAPIRGKTKRLEEERFVGMQRIWENHKLTTKNVIEAHISALESLAKSTEVKENATTVNGKK